MSEPPVEPSATTGAMVIRAPNQLPGRRFQPTAERSLDPELELIASRWRVGSDGQRLLLSECALPFGIPDLVILVLDEQELQQRLDSGLPAFTSPTDVRLLASCSYRWRITKSLTADLGVSSGQADRVLSRLIRVGALEERRGRVRTVPSVQPIGRIFALEAKVSDWRAGLEQCLRYAAHAETASLVLGRVPQGASESMRALAGTHGLGISHGGKWLVRPRSRRHSLATRLLASEYVLSGLGSLE